MLEKLPAGLGQALRGVRPGLEKTAYADEAFAEAPETLVLESASFADGAAMPVAHTADVSAGVSPPLSWRGAPAGTVCVALLVEDADSPTPAPLVHAVAWNLEPEGSLTTGALNGDAGQVDLGKNSFLQTGWLPPDPPPGHGPHRYVVQAYALSRRLELTGKPGRADLLKAMDGAVLAKGQLIGTYERS